MARQVLEYSKTRVNKAGRGIRAFFNEPSEDEMRALVEHLDVALNFRAAHQYPLQKATMGLRSMVRSEGATLQVSQRLKRMNTIIDKLARQPEMELSRMQDIGGCRAVLNDPGELHAVARRLRRNGKVQREVDYIERPAPSGYRGYHVIVCYDERMIEVQLRTKLQHEWAVAVERLGGRIDHDLKSGRGPVQVLDLLQAVSQAMALEEKGERPDAELLDLIATLRVAAQPFMGGGPR